MKTYGYAVLLGLLARTAHAHPSPAEPPSFFDDTCIVVIDKRAQPVFHLDYAVLTDDTAPEVDHVALPDSKTHQFFALAGTLHARANDHVFIAFDDDREQLTTMPTWLNADDVMRTAAAVTPEDMTAFSADQVSAADVLENDAELARVVRPMAAGAQRVPITAAQASAGVDWDLRDVPPGAYQIAAYIFSPPYNGWAVRPGLIKVVDSADAAHEPAAVTLAPVAARLFAGQGRRVRGCVHAPEGSTLELSTRVQAEVPGAFEPFATQPVEGDSFELCLPNEGRDVVLELRATVRTPAGLFAATQASEGLSLFSTAATACVESELLCCPEVLAPDAGAARDDAATAMTPEQPSTARDAARPDEPSEPAPTAPSDASVPVQPPVHKTGGSEGCAAAGRGTGSAAWIALALLAFRGRSLARRFRLCVVDGGDGTELHTKARAERRPG